MNDYTHTRMPRGYKRRVLTNSPLAVAERTVIIVALQDAKGNVSEAARILKINRNTLKRMLETHNLVASEFKYYGEKKHGL